MPLDQIDPLKQALKDANTTAEVEIYRGTEHGFAFPARAVYNKQAAERHWERLYALFRRRLG
jgi:carboxymethylenebutenolidase